MLNDTDLWPVLCPECRNAMKKQIGRLKSLTSIKCHQCGAAIGFRNITFSKVIEQARREIDTRAREADLTFADH